MRKIGMESSPFLNEVRASIRLRGMSLRTEKTYICWIRNFIRYSNYRHPRDRALMSEISGEQVEDAERSI